MERMRYTPGQLICRIHPESEAEAGAAKHHLREVNAVAFAPVCVGMICTGGNIWYMTAEEHSYPISSQDGPHRIHRNGL